MRASLYQLSLSKVWSLVGLMTVILLMNHGAYAQASAAANTQALSVEEMFKIVMERKAGAVEIKGKAEVEKALTLSDRDFKNFDLFKSQTPKFKELRMKRGGGGMDGGGGDSRALEFFKIADAVYEKLKKNPDIANDIDLDAFRDFIATADVVFTKDELFLNGSRREQINFPSKRQIHITIEDWDKLHDANRKAGMVMHEFLGLLGIDDAGYKRSRKILKSAGIVIPKNYAKVVAEPGTILDTYDLFAAQLSQVWNNGKGDHQKTKQMSESILRIFYGFSSIQIEQGDVKALEALYKIATQLRELLPYDTSSEGFVRLSDGAKLTSTHKAIFFVVDDMRHELILGKSSVWSVQERKTPLDILQKMRGEEARFLGCQVSLPSQIISGYPQIILRQIFAMAYNCGGNKYRIDTNLNFVSFEE